MGFTMFWWAVTGFMTTILALLILDYYLWRFKRGRHINVYIGGDHLRAALKGQMPENFLELKPKSPAEVSDQDRSRPQSVFSIETP